MILLVLLLQAAANDLFASFNKLTPQWEAMTVTEKRRALKNIARSCDLPKSALRFRPGDELLFQPPVTAKFEAIECALDKIKVIRGFDKIGFIGNEKYEAEEK